MCRLTFVSHLPLLDRVTAKVVFPLEICQRAASPEANDINGRGRFQIPDKRNSCSMHFYFLPGWKLCFRDVYFAVLLAFQGQSVL